jgi:hypothetical protein
MPVFPTIRVKNALNRAHASTDNNDDIQKQYELQRQVVLADNSLTEDEKTETIRELSNIHDRYKIIYNSGTERICEICNQGCLATLYCENCVRNYLKTKFLDWTSENDDIDNLIKKCQIETLYPNMIAEWIPYNNLQNIKYLTKGEHSEIYKATWINGHYLEWDSKEQQLKRFGRQEVILKRLENVKSANQSWFEEVCDPKYLKYLKLKQFYLIKLTKDSFFLG